jgi:hypothetical protein
MALPSLAVIGVAARSCRVEGVDYDEPDLKVRGYRELLLTNLV